MLPLETKQSGGKLLPHSDPPGVGGGVGGGGWGGGGPFMGFVALKNLQVP